MQFRVVPLFLLLLTAICPSTPVVADDLLEALKTSANAGKFAAALESDPVLKAIFLDPSIKTVFAPSDQAMEAFTNNPPDIPRRRFRIRDTNPDDQAALSMSASDTQTDTNKERTVPGTVYSTSKSAKTPSKKANVVSNPSSSKKKKKNSKRGYLGPVPMLSALSPLSQSMSAYQAPQSAPYQSPPPPPESHIISYASPESISYPSHPAPPPPPPPESHISYPPHVETTSCTTPPPPPPPPYTPPPPPPVSTTIIPPPPVPTETLLPIQMFSGLGRSVNIIKQDVPFNGGFIHVIDGLVKPPERQKNG